MTDINSPLLNFCDEIGDWVITRRNPLAKPLTQIDFDNMGEVGLAMCHLGIKLASMSPGNEKIAQRLFTTGARVFDVIPQGSIPEGWRELESIEQVASRPLWQLYLLVPLANYEEFREDAFRAIVGLELDSEGLGLREAVVESALAGNWSISRSELHELSKRLKNGMMKFSSAASRRRIEKKVADFLTS